jgi:hypothetical protein
MMHRLVAPDTFSLNHLERWAQEQGWTPQDNARTTWRCPLDATEIIFLQDDIGHFSYLTITGPHANNVRADFMQMGFPNGLAPWIDAIWATFRADEDDEPLTDQRLIELLRRVCVQSLAFNQDVLDLLQEIFRKHNQAVRWQTTLALALLPWEEIRDLLLHLRFDRDPMISAKADEIFHTRQPESPEKSLEFFLTMAYPEKNQKLIIVDKLSDFNCRISVRINQRWIPWPEEISITYLLDFLIPFWIWTAEPIEGEEETRSEPFILDMYDHDQHILQHVVTTTTEGFIWRVYQPERGRPFPTFEGLTLTREAAREGILDFKRVLYQSLLDSEETIERREMVNEWWRYHLHEDPQRLIPSAGRL